VKVFFVQLNYIIKGIRNIMNATNLTQNSLQNSRYLRLYSLSQAAKMLGVGRDTLKSLIAQGKIGVIKILKQNKIADAELQRFITENTKCETGPTTEINVKSFLNDSIGKKKINTESVFDTMMKEIK